MVPREPRGLRRGHGKPVRARRGALRVEPPPSLRVEGLDAAGWRNLLGRKVSVRYALYDDPEHRATEAIGMVASVKDDDRGTTISLVNRRGETVSFLLKNLVAGKIFPS